MKLTRLRIQNFRNIETASLEFPPGPVLLVGKNAQGKTSLLEAVYFLATATSHRTRKNRELIRRSSEGAFVGAEFESHDRSFQLSGGIGENERRFRLDGQPLVRSSDLYGHFRAVFFSPEDLILVSGSPSDRRRFLDLGLCQKNPAMVRVLLDYRRVLKQRNALLKSNRHSALKEASATLRAWDPQIAEWGVQVTRQRAHYALELLRRAGEYYEEIAQTGECLSGGYRSSAGRATWKRPEEVPSHEDLLEVFRLQLEKDLEKDLSLRVTHSGPHRDDLLFEVGGTSAPTFASQGQRRTIALAVKLAESDLLVEDGDFPVLLVDDVTHEMDEGRCRRFLDQIARKGQALLTFTEVTPHRHLLEGAHLWKVEAGGFLRES